MNVPDNVMSRLGVQRGEIETREKQGEEAACREENSKIPKECFCVWRAISRHRVEI